MVHSALLGSAKNLKCIAIDGGGKIGGEGLRVSLPLLLAFLNHRSMGVGLRKRGRLSSRTVCPEISVNANKIV